MRISLGAGLISATLVSGQLLAQQLPIPEAGEVTRKGTRAAQFLQLGVGARGMALGQAYAAYAEGADALFYNPAGIAFTDRWTVYGTTTDLFAEINHDFVGLIVPLARLGMAFGVSVNSVRTPDDLIRTEAFPEGGDPDIGGGPFNANFLAVGVSYAVLLTDRFSFGGTAKFVQERIFTDEAESVNFDVGALFHTGLYGTTVAISLRNFGPDAEIDGPAIRDRILPENADEIGICGEFAENCLEAQFVTEDQEQPSGAHFGLRVEVLGRTEALVPSQVHRLNVLGEIADAINTDEFFGVGIEYVFSDLLFGRIGRRINFGDKGNSIDFGGGIKIPLGRDWDLRFDYANVDFGPDLGNVDVFSAQVMFK